MMKRLLKSFKVLFTSMTISLWYSFIFCLILFVPGALIFAGATYLSLYVPEPLLTFLLCSIVICLIGFLTFGVTYLNQKTN